MKDRAFSVERRTEVTGMGLRLILNGSAGKPRACTIRVEDEDNGYDRPKALETNVTRAELGELIGVLQQLHIEMEDL